MTTETFAPQAVVDGVTVTPEGWMWILALALNDVSWAVEAASKPEFTAKVADYQRRRRLYFLELAEARSVKETEYIRTQIASLQPKE